MSQNILDPKDEMEASEGREVKPNKTVQQPSSVPTLEVTSSSAPTLEQAQAQPAQEQAQPEQTQAQPAQAQVEPTQAQAQPAQAQVEPTQAQAQPAQEQAHLTLQNPGVLTQLDTSSLVQQKPRLVTGNRFTSINSGDIRNITDPTVSTEMGINDMLGGLDPANVAQRLTVNEYDSGLAQEDLSMDYPSIIGRYNDVYRDSVDAYDKFINAPVFGADYHNYYVLPDGSIVPKVPGTDLGISSRGLNSELGKTLQDEIDPSGKNNTHRNLVSWFFEDAFNVAGAAWYNFADIPVIGLLNPWADIQKMRNSEGWKKSKEEANARFGQTVNRLSNTNPKFHLSQEANTEDVIGDYGNAGLLSGLVYVLNTPLSVLSGGVYDVADKIVEWRTGKDPYEGSRTADALLRGRDWVFSGRWSEEKYLNLQEPQNLKPGTITGNWWWDLPERVSSATGGFLPVQQAHWLIQAPVAVGLEMLGDGLVDASLLKLAGGTIPEAADVVGTALPKTVDILESISKKSNIVLVSKIDDGAEVIGDMGQVARTTDHAEDLRAAARRPRLQESPIEGKERRALPQGEDVIDVEYREIKRKAEPGRRVKVIPDEDKLLAEAVETPQGKTVLNVTVDGRKVISVQVGSTPRPVKPYELVVTDPSEFVPNVHFASTIRRPSHAPRLTSVMDIVPRNNGQLTVIGQHLVDPGTNRSIIPATFGGVADDLELAELRRVFPMELAKYGSNINPVKMDADVLLLPDGQVLDIPKISVPEELKTIELNVGVAQDYAQVTKQMEAVRAEFIWKAQNGELSANDISKYAEKINNLSNARRYILMRATKHGGGYTLFKSELPAELVSETDEAALAGNLMLESQLRLEGIMDNITYLRAAVDDLADLHEDLVKQIDVLGVARGDLDVSVKTKNWGDDLVDETIPDAGDMDAAPRITDEAELQQVFGTEPVPNQELDVIKAPDVEPLSSKFDDVAPKQVETLKMSMPTVGTPSFTRPVEPKSGGVFRKGARQPSMSAKDVRAAAEADMTEKAKRIKAEPTQVKTEPTQVKVEPAQVKTEPAQVKVEPAPAKVEPTPAQVKTEPAPAPTKAKPTQVKTKEEPTTTDEYGLPLEPEKLGRGKHYFPTGEETKKLVNPDIEGTWYHGTRTSSKMNVVSVTAGASPSELGKGVYLTHDRRIAEAAAKRLAPGNRPSPTGATFKVEDSRVVQVNVKQYHQHTVDLNNTKIKSPVIDPKTGKWKPTRSLEARLYLSFEGAAKTSTGDDTFVKFYMDSIKNKPVAESWNRFRTAYRDFFGRSPSESEVDLFQSLVTKDFQKIDVWAGKFVGKDGTEVMVLYRPNYVGEYNPVKVDSDGSMVEALENARYLDQRTYEMFPDEVNLANYKASQLQQTQYTLQRASEYLAEETQASIDELETMFSYRKQLQDTVQTEVHNRVKSHETSIPKVEQKKAASTRAKRYEKREEINPC